jgi:hypothetical protein
MIDLTSNWIVVRAIAARLEELESKTAPTAREAAERAHLEGLLARLRVPRGDFPWREYIYPIQLVRDDYFTEYSKQLAQCFGDEVPDNVVIDDSDSVDWEATAQLERADYASITIRGVTYWYLSGEKDGEDHFNPREYEWEEVLFH